MAWYNIEDGRIITDEEHEKDCCDCLAFCAEGNVSDPCKGDRADCPHYETVDTSEYDKEIRAQAITEFAEKLKSRAVDYYSDYLGSNVDKILYVEDIDRIATELKGE